MARTVGVIESRSYLELFDAAARAAKAADVRFVRYERVGEGIVAAVLEGDLANVEVALEAAKNGHNGVSGTNSLVTRLVTNVPSKALRVFNLPGGWIWNP